MTYTAGLVRPLMLPLWIDIVVAGLLLGSFLNVCIERLPRHQSIAWPGSRCPRCLAPIRPWDNIPVLSYFLLHGRCRSCRAPIRARYLLMELATAVLFLLSAWKFGLTLEGASAALLCWLLLGLIAMDWETMLLPDTVTLPGLALGLVHAAAVAGPPAMHRLEDLGGALVASVAGAGAMLAIRWGYWLVRRRHGLGLGDVKMVAMIAAWMGVLPTLLVFVLATLGGAVAGLAVAGIRGRRVAGREGWGATRLPLGAFLGAAALLVLFAGQPMIAWYLGQFPP
jgi:leader peptidase (prepilin peptidase)/N-methyltransferase